MKFPGFGGVKVSPAAPGQEATPAPDLDTVISALDSSDRAAKWFADDDVRPGDWVHFEAPISYTQAWFSVIFVDLDQPTESYPTGGAVRLMLHGSDKHIVGNWAERENYDSAAGDLPEPTGSELLRVWMLLKKFDDVYTDDAGQERSDSAGLPELFSSEGDDPITERFGRVLDALSKRLALRQTAAWMAGYARVTAVLAHATDRRIITATPLYVEYVSEPPTLG